MQHNKKSSSREKMLEALQPGLSKDAELSKIHGDNDMKAKESEVTHMHHDEKMGKDIKGMHERESLADKFQVGAGGSYHHRKELKSLT